MQGINTWPGTAEDMIDRLIAGYSTGLGVLIDTITYSGFHSGAVNRQAAGMTYTWHWDQLTCPLSLAAFWFNRWFATQRNRDPGS